MTSVQTERQTDICPDRETDREREIERERETHTHRGERETDRDRDRERDERGRGWICYGQPGIAGPPRDGGGGKAPT